MMPKQTETPSTQNLHILATHPLVSPRELKERYPLTPRVVQTVIESRDTIKHILLGQDDRLMAVVGPCSIHDPKAGIEYAQRLNELAQRVKERIFLVMRVYFEKPRTTVGWKGLINDPNLDDSFDVEGGLSQARKILSDIGEMGLPVATEVLEPITPQYIADLISLASIGARTTESPTHRQMASGLSMPVGYKNGTDGSLDVALNAMISARTPHSFLGIDEEGDTCVVQTTGNQWGHLILRGGRHGPNFSAKNLQSASEQLAKAGLPPTFLVDCSHGNSEKDYSRQAAVWRDVVEQRVAGNLSAIGLMLESNLKPGNQKLGDDPSALEYGVSITDACVGWEETEKLVMETFEKLG